MFSHKAIRQFKCFKCGMWAPFRKVSKTRKRMRRAHNALEAKTVTTCPNCKEVIKPHRVCKACGNYKGKQVIEVESEKQAI